MTIISCVKSDVITVTVDESTTYEQIDYYDGTTYDEKEQNYLFNKEIFYRNDFNQSMADPGVLEITDPDDPDYGKFYAYGTRSGHGFEAFCSEDLANWEGRGWAYLYRNSDSVEDKIAYSNVWAPEVVYDSKEKMYYMFFSSTPQDAPYYYPFIAKADNPRGPFLLIDHSDEYLEADGTAITNPDHYFYKYMTFDPYKLYAALESGGFLGNNHNKEQMDSYFERSIDYHPWIDTETGTRYIFYKHNLDGADVIMGVPCDKSFNEPIYDDIQMLIKAKLPTLDAEMGDMISYEVGTNCNEGPWITQHKGKYYLTYSINSYTDRSYAVGVAVSDNALGPYRKLDQDEGGLFLSTDLMMRDDISGPGHHSMVEKNGHLYIVYHKHDDVEAGGAARNLGCDEVKWVTIKDKYGEDLDIMVLNGPTNSIQPKFEFASDYVNIAPKATIKATNVSSDSSSTYLNDDLLSMLRVANQDMVTKYIKETEFDGETKIDIEFGDFEKVKSVMVYNSKEMANAFYDIKKITFYGRDENGRDKNYFIDNLKFNFAANTSIDDSDIIRPGCAAFAEFDEIDVKKITIEVDPATADQIAVHGENGVDLAISEIKVLARK